MHDDPADHPVVVRVQVQHQQCGLRGDDDADRVVEGEAARRLPPLAGQQEVGDVQQPAPLLVVEQLPDRPGGVLPEPDRPRAAPVASGSAT
jgi:hypothetical protein